ncbi:hypothetical protein ACHQM5_008850 [Ranunculus cassubicifolius]
MDPFPKIPFTASLLLLSLMVLAFLNQARGDSIVTGTVFCDQCKDGKMSLFDYPLSSMKVRITCGWIEKEETTNWVGSYSVRFDGNPDLSSCYAHLLGGNNVCAALAGPPQQLRLVFRFFNVGMYTVNTLLSQPAQPMSICPRPTNPPPLPPVSIILPTPPPPPPRPTNPPPLPPVSIILPTPPPPPRLTFPFFQASACSHEIWLRPEYRCHWRFVHPDTKVVVAFGLIAGRRYGTDMNLWQGIQGRGDIYRTLLREATTALLNSYNSIQFRYPTLIVLEQLNWALMATPKDALLMALRFKRANSGYGNATHCNLTTCKG